MPKKSNKTAHVLSLLTNGSGTLNDADTSEDQETAPVKEVPPAPSELPSSEASSKVIVEIQGEPKDDILSDLVKQELEQEFKNKEKSVSPPNPFDESAEKSKLNEKAENSLSTGTEEPEEIDEIKTDEIVKFVFEEFEEEEDQDMPAELKVNEEYELVSDPSTAKILHNLAEDVIRARVPEIMKSFNMCTCQNCTYDVMAFALNHVAPLYTVSDKGHLFQKLSSYETQYGADLTSAITKACIRVKINPNHENTTR